MLAGLAYELPGFALTLAVGFAIAAAALWLLGAKTRARQLHNWSAISNMYALSSDGFEAHVAETYAALGYRTTVTPRVGDQGLDVIAERGGERIGIQCKRTTETVSNSAVQEAYAGKAHYRCSSAVVIALGGFTGPARALASSTGVSLIDGPAYADMFHRASATFPPRRFWTVLPNRRYATSAGLCAAVALVAVGLASAHAPSAQTLSLSPRTVYAASTPGDTVRRFYAAISSHDFATAYSLLSPSFKQSMSLASFESGYATTLNVLATTSNDAGPNVNVHLVATDRDPDGLIRTTIFDGSWTAVPNPYGGWLLDDGHFSRG